MAALYSPEGSPLLSSAAGALDGPTLDAWAVMAERVLGLAGTSFEGDDAAEAASYVARQVNLMIGMEDKAGIVSESKGQQSVKYASVGGQRIPVDPIAKAGADALLGPEIFSSSSSRSEFVW